MANYFLDDNGAITDSNGNSIKKKKKKNGNNYIMSEDGTISLNRSSNSTKNLLTIEKNELPTKNNKSSFKNTVNLLNSFNLNKKENNFKRTVNLLNSFNQHEFGKEEEQQDNNLSINERLKKSNEDIKNKITETNARIQSKKYNQTNKPTPVYKTVSNKVGEVINSLDNIASNAAIGTMEVIPNQSEYVTSVNNTIAKNLAQSATSKILGIDSNSSASKIISNTISEKIQSSNPKQQFNDYVLNSEEAKNWRNETIQKNINEAEGTIGKKLAELAPSIGNNLFNMAVSAVNPAVGTASFMTSAAGSYLEDARNIGMTEEQSLMYGTIMGAVEGGTEAIISGNMLEHGAQLFGVGGVQKEALHKIVNSFGFDIAENFAQEALTEPINEIAKYIVAGDEYADFSNMGERMLKSGIDGAISSIILAGSSIGINSAIKLSENISNGKSVNQNQIKKVIENCKNAGIPVNDILVESIKENTNALSQNINENNANQIQGLQEEISKKHQEWKQSTDAREKQIIQETIDNLNNELQNITTTQSLANQTQSKENNTYLESARRYNIDTNNQTVKAIDQVTSQRGIQTRFDRDVFTNSSANALWRTSTDSNGNTVREVILNPSADTNKTLQNVIVHELTHDIEGSKEYSELKDLITNYDKNNIDYESARKSLEEIYSKVYDKNSSEFKTLVENEAVADILGSKLGDQEFITNLTTEKPSIAKRIYNWVVDKLNKINKLTGYKNEKLFWNDVKNKFENAYRQDYQGNNTNTKYHVSENLSAEIDKVLNGQYPSNEDVKLRDFTPKVLVDSGIRDLPMLINQNHLKENILSGTKAKKMGMYNKDANYHNLGKETFMKAIDNLDNPLMIMKSISKTSSQNTYVIVTDVQNKNGEHIIVPIYIEGKGNYNSIRTDTNKVKSVYGKNNIKNLVDNTIKGDINNIIYMTKDKNKRQLLTSTGLQLSNSSITASKNSISPSSKDVNTTKYSMQDSKDNTKNNNIWKSYLDKNYKNSGTGETIQDVKNQNSNESSFILPVNNQNNNINLPTNNSQNNELSDAAKEFSSPTIDYIKDKRSKNRANLKEIKDALAQKFVNKGHYIDKLARQSGNKNITYLYDRTMNTFNEAQISIGEKQINSKGDVVGKSIIDLFEPAEKANLSKEFQDYLLNKHNISRYAHEKGIYGKEISAVDSSKTVAEYEKLYPYFKKWAEEVSKYNDNNLKDLVDNGLIAQSTYKKLKELYPDYVPTYRDIVDNISQYEDDRVGSNTLKRATQSDREILSVSESMAEQTLAIKKAIRMNNLGIELYRTLGKNSEIFDGIQYDTYAIETLGGDVIEKAENGDNIFTIFVNGNMTQFKISDELYSAFSKDTLQNKINNSKVAKTLLTPIEKLTKAQRELLTTYNIGFAFSNPIKDFNDALVNTKYSQARFMKNYVKALYNLGTKGSYYESYKNNGGMANTYFDYDKGILPTSSRNPLKKFVDKIKNVNEILEQAPRIAEYISTIEKGGSVDEALYNAADITTNFKRGGDIAKVFNKYGVNFLNASIQGLDKIYRNISGQNGARGYFNLLVKASLASVAPAILNHLLLGDDEDYENLQDYIKDNYYLFKAGDGTFYRIPKGRISSVLGGLARRVLETAEGKEVDWDSLVETVSNSFAPNNPFDDNLLAPLKQASENKTWYGTDLVPSRLQDLPSAEQYDETTDKFSIWLGEKLNISPYKINYVLDQYSGGIGDTVLPMMTQQAEGNSDSMGAKLLAPLADKFTTDSVMKNKNVSKFYSLAEEINVNSNSSKATDEQILQNKYLNTIKSEMSDLYKEKREIQASDLPDSEKYNQAREIQRQINDLAETGLANYENVNITGNYAEVNGTKYQKEDGSWKKISDDKSEKLDQMNMELEEKNEYLQFESNLDEISSKYKEQVEALNENSSTYDEEKSKISSQKKTEIVNSIINSGLTDEKKLSLYEDYYSSDTVKIAYKAGINIDSCLSYDLQTFTADRDENGKTISGSKKEKVINYVNSLNLSIPQKAILIKTNNSFKFNDYNNEIVDYINNLNLTYYEKKELLEELDMKVLDDGTIIWE